MPVKRGVQLRRCSVCGKTGHNAAKCLLSVKKRTVEKTAETRQNIKLSKQVFVKTFHSHPSSPHVVDLKKAENRHVWQEAPVFSEIIKAKAESHQVANLAEMVRKANVVRNVGRGTRNVEVRKKAVMVSKINISSNLTAFKNFIIHQLSFIIYRLSFFSFRRLVYGFIVIALLASLPFPAVAYYNQVKNTSVRVAVESTNAFKSLQASTLAAFQNNLPQAESDLNEALRAFGQANYILENEHQVLQYVAGLLPVVGPQVVGRESLVSAGQHLALGNTYLLKGIVETQKSTGAPTERFTILANHLKSALPQYQEAQRQLVGVNKKILPVEQQVSFADFKILFTALVSDLGKLTQLADSLNLVFGSEGLKRYLLVFQNNSELRPSGGFMGSFAIVDVQKGKIINWEIPGGGTYDLQGQLDVFVKPPLPLQLVNKRWEFQDANWFPDFAASAQKIAWFYQHGRNTSVDGVIAINASVLERLLQVWGPVVNEQTGLTLTAEAGLETLQSEVDRSDAAGSEKPKAVLGELAGQFLEKFKQLNAVNALSLLTQLQEALAQKEIQVYFNDETLQQHFRQFGWTGEILPTRARQDYLAVISANLQGEKSDAKIKQVIEHQAVVNADGSIVDTVVIHRTHLGVPGEAFYGVPNVNYLRLYVPEGSELLAAGGFNYPPEGAFKVPEVWYQNDSDLGKNEKFIKTDKTSGTQITQEFGKTVFGNWFIINPGTAGSIYFTYRLPFKLNLGDQPPVQGQNRLTTWLADFGLEQKSGTHYSLVVQKQSGLNSDFSSRLIFPINWQPVWKEPAEMVLALNGAEYLTVLQEDQWLGLAMENQQN